MRYVSLDIETTGLDAQIDQLIMLALVVEDTDVDVPVESLPYFVGYVKRDRYSGQPVALAMNAKLISWINKAATGFVPGKDADQQEYVSTSDEFIGMKALEWLWRHFDGRVTVAGKNAAGFDIPFLPQNLRARFRHRVIDAGSVLVDWRRSEIPTLGDLKAKCGLGSDVAHDALEDARDVIRVLRCSPGYRP